MSINRRNFLKISAFTAGTLVGSSKKVSASESRDSFGHTYSMLNDSAKCIGCRACQSACKDSKGFKKTGCMGVGIIVNDPLKPVLHFGLQGDNITPISNGNQILFLPGFPEAVSLEVFEPALEFPSEVCFFPPDIFQVSAGRVRNRAVGGNGFNDRLCKIRKSGSVFY